MMKEKIHSLITWMMIPGKKTKMKTFMKLIKEFLFGRRAEAVCQIKKGYHTVQPKLHSKDFYEWCKEFRVGILSDRKPINY